MYEFLIKYWPIIALVISELLAFIPAKWNGIAHTVFKVLQMIFGNKEKEAIRANNKKLLN